MQTDTDSKAIMTEISANYRYGAGYHFVLPYTNFNYEVQQGVHHCNTLQKLMQQQSTILEGEG